MKKLARTALEMAAVLLAVAGCSSITGPRLETSFEWGEVDDATTVQEGVQSAVALGELFILGQLQTPTRCYTLDPDFRRKGSRLTLRIEARPTGAVNCEPRLGGYRYTVVVYNLKFGTYELRVFHDVAGGRGGEFTRTVTLR